MACDSYTNKAVILKERRKEEREGVGERKEEGRKE